MPIFTEIVKLIINEPIIIKGEREANLIVMATAN